MGAGIAQVAATAGHPVLLFDAVDGAVDKALADLQVRMEKSVAKGRRTEEEAKEILDLIVGCGWLADCGPASLVIEAIVENLDVKRRVLADLEEIAGSDAIIATNTSSLSITAIASALVRPERLVGMHFFNPAPAMPLVEIVSGAATSVNIAAAAYATATDWGKTPVHCTSTPGFIVNRVARPFYGEGLRLAAEGAADIATIDALMTGSGGFRMGPFSLMDLVGLDVNLAVSKSVFEQSFHDSRFAPNVMQQIMVDSGRLGRKTGCGFYDYADDAPDVAPVTLDAATAPARVEVLGALSWATGLSSRLEAAGVSVGEAAADGPGHLSFEGVRLVPTDGRPATELAADGVFESDNVVVFDLVHDWENVAHVGLAVADQAEPGTALKAAGLFQAIGCTVSLVADTPGLVVMRTVAQLVAVAADAVNLGVATSSDVDAAMRLGTNYPSGPLEWADRIGLARIATVLENLHAGYGEDRYRVPPLIRRHATTGRSLRPGVDRD
jgi:3-hydroxybutyryl-CoA dehydrogenase